MSDDRSYPDKKKGTLRTRLAYWTAEVVLVFVGVGGVLAEQLQQHDQEAKQRDRILAALERTLREGIASEKVTPCEGSESLPDFSVAFRPAPNSNALSGQPSIRSTRKCAS
jgi:hypothetical protein